ncbi:DUF3140 domain-containing protein [Thermomonospora cellulosilytica]|uniref:Ethanolamine utilization protein EutP (Predicted NTPase) n=1 Tax=Thermomonospora cellulosilytica TaxID=1411118 RepID=A0A7W3N176_9ACTN|nr:DUF3140 domain-containing protein [Thermomonospora cellulosilytica]MBA9005587.1 ethanolamine utilization protein EutP (predicted NTPase) [Thermomonospora cellulosilytica]
MPERTSAEVESLWEEFHHAVTMTSQELRTWLLTEASGEVAFPADPDLKLPDVGRHVVGILGKRKVDLTDEDTRIMRQVVEFVSERLADPPAEGAQNERWRHELMTVGHDPLKPEGGTA